MDYTDEYLQSMRQVADPLSDQAIEMIFQHGHIGQVNAVFRALVRNDGIPEFSDYDISGYLQDTSSLPQDLDRAKLKLAEHVFLKFGPTMFLVLFCKSLPECYCCAKGAQVLYTTGRLTNQAANFEPYTRRLMETAQFFVNVLEPNALTKDGKGVVSAQKVRLVHASIRRYLRQAGWDEKAYDAPINQEDLLGTMLSFSVTIIEGLDKLGAHLSNEEREAYYYHWTVVGRLMGILPEHIPGNLQDAILLKQRILEHQMAPSEAGNLLTQAAVNYMAYMIPGKGFDEFPEKLMMFLLNPKVASGVGLKADRSIGGAIAMALLRVGTEFQSHLGDTGLVRSMAKRYEVKLLEAIFKHYNDHKNVHFFVPPNVKDRWTSVETEAETELAMQLDPLAGKITFPATDCHQVVGQLERLIGRCKVDGNAIGFFASLYRLTTLKIVAAVDQGIFEDNARMAKMDLTFARRYLDAVAVYFDGGKASAAWEVAFSVATDSSVNVIQQLLLGMNAHINLDLAVAAATIAPGDQINAFENDFKKINAILKSLMDLTAHDLSEVWPPLKGMLTVGEWAGKPLAGLLMVREREHAWDKAVRLAGLSGQAQVDAINQMDQETAKLGEEVLKPGLLLRPVFWAVTRMQKGSVSWQIEQFHNDLET